MVYEHASMVRYAYIVVLLFNYSYILELQSTNNGEQENEFVGFAVLVCPSTLYN
jgi:hypothetical protein